MTPGLADAQAEIARLRAIEAAANSYVVAHQDTVGDPAYRAYDVLTRALAAAPAPAEDEGRDCPGCDASVALCAKLTRLCCPSCSHAPAPAREQADPADGGGSGDVCPKPIRVGGPGHSWRFDGDDPYIICVGCDEMRDAINGRVVRAALPAPAPAEDECGAGHDPERICCAHARDVERLRVDRELHQDRADRLAVELMRLRDQIGEVIAADRSFENGPASPAPAREQADPADETACTCDTLPDVLPGAGHSARCPLYRRDDR